MTVAKVVNFEIKLNKDVYVPKSDGVYKECLHEDGMQ